MPEHNEGASSQTSPQVSPENRVKSLLDMEDTEAAARMRKDWDDSYASVKGLIPQWKVNRLRAKGYAGVQLQKRQDEMRAYVPKGAVPSPVAMNKANRLRRRVRAMLFADPPLPECLPASGDDKDVDTAEFSTRVLTDLCSESNLSYPLLMGDAFDLGADHGSGFTRFFVDPQGGGWQPRTIMAHPKATVEQGAELDPQTQQPAGKEELIKKYVTKQGALTDDKMAPDLDIHWLPAMRYELLTGRQVRLIPATSRDIWEADGAMVGAMVPWVTLKSTFPELAKMDAEAIQELAADRPSSVKDLLPLAQQKALGLSTEVTDETLIFTLTRYHRQSSTYPKGFYGCCVGKDTLLHRQAWYDEQHQSHLDIPITQLKQFTEDGNPYGYGMMDALGAGNEQLARMSAFEDEYLERFARRKTFLPTVSILSPDQLQMETRTVIPINAGGQPIEQEIPDFPQMVEKSKAATSLEMDDESGLQQAGQALNVPSVQSGDHAKIILDQIAVGLSDLRQNAERGLVRGWRILLQQVRFAYTVPQRLQYVGENGQYLEEEWSGADLGSTRDVQIARGSFTQLSRQAKADLVDRYVAAKYMTPEEAADVVASGVGGLLGLQDNPHRQRVRGQISRWRKGPPKDWTPPQMVMGQNGQPQPGPDPIGAQIFNPLAVDDEPDVAKLRLYELGRACSGQRYQQMLPAWRVLLDTEYQRARRSAGVVTAQEQQQQAGQAYNDQKGRADAETQAKVAESQRKPPSLSVSVSTTPLDSGQTQVVLTQMGLQVPPRTEPLPQPAMPSGVKHLRNDKGEVVRSEPEFAGAPS